MHSGSALQPARQTGNLAAVRDMQDTARAPSARFEKRTTMHRRVFIASLVATLATAGASLADNFSDNIVLQLRQQGYAKIEMKKTWLGRVRILATSADAQREIILNPRTGEILRDFWQPLGGGHSAGGGLISSSSSSGKATSSGRTSSDDVEDTEDEAEDPENEVEDSDQEDSDTEDKDEEDKDTEDRDEQDDE
jgi:hypothetical protein